jgi:drug/metabolite transporter (DMT)-like permease
MTNFGFAFWTHGVLYLLLLLLGLWVLKRYPLPFLTGGKSDVLAIPNNNQIKMWLVISGTFAFLALITIIYTFSISKNIGCTVAIISTTSAITYVLSHYMFGTEINTQGILGIVVIIMAVYIIGNSNNTSKVEIDFQ